MTRAVSWAAAVASAPLEARMCRSRLCRRAEVGAGLVGAGEGVARGSSGRCVRVRGKERCGRPSVVETPLVA